MDSYNSIFKHYGIPQEIIDEISLWTHKIKFADILMSIEAGRGGTINDGIILFPRPAPSFCDSRLGPLYTALEQSNFIYEVLNGKRVTPNLYIFIYHTRVKPKTPCSRCDDFIGCKAFVHKKTCDRFLYESTIYSAAKKDKYKHLCGLDF